MGLGIPRTHHFLFSFLFGSFPNSNILLASISYIHRPPATMRDYIFVGGCDLLSSRSRFHYSVSSVLLVCLCISIAFCADGVDPPIIVSIPRNHCRVSLFSLFLVSRVSRFFFVIALWFHVHASTSPMGGYSNCTSPPLGSLMKLVNIVYIRCSARSAVLKLQPRSCCMWSDSLHEYNQRRDIVAFLTYRYLHECGINIIT